MHLILRLHVANLVPCNDEANGLASSPTTSQRLDVWSIASILGRYVFYKEGFDDEDRLMSLSNETRELVVTMSCSRVHDMFGVQVVKRRFFPRNFNIFTYHPPSHEPPRRPTSKTSSDTSHLPNSELLESFHFQHGGGRRGVSCQSCVSG